MAKALLHELGKSLSFGRLSLKAKVLWPMLLASSDTQGRGVTEADAVKWRVCPNVPEITVDDVPALLQELQDQGMIHLYECDAGRTVYQVVHWWDYQALHWARPSRFSPPEGWFDRIRYQTKDGIVQENWNGPRGFAKSLEKETPLADSPVDPPVDPSANPPENPLENRRDGCVGDYVGGCTGHRAAECTADCTVDRKDDQPNLTEPNSNQENVPAGAASPGGEREETFSLPSTFAEWYEAVRASDNRYATLRRMIQVLYPNRDPPDYAYIGKVAKRVGGAGRLADLLWQHSTRPPTGDLLAYILAVAKGKRAKQPSEPVEEVPLATGWVDGE